MFKIFASILIFYENKLQLRINLFFGKVLKNTIINKGVNLKMLGYSKIKDRNKLNIGDNVRIGENCYFFCRGGISIGDNTVLSRNITIYSASHDYNDEYLPFGKKYNERKVEIGKNVWIGMNVNILPGTIIGDGSIIGMGATISGNVSPYSIIVNQKFRALGNRDKIAYKKLDDSKKYFNKFF